MTELVSVRASERESSVFPHINKGTDGQRERYIEREGEVERILIYTSRMSTKSSCQAMFIMDPL